MRRFVFPAVVLSLVTAGVALPPSSRLTVSYYDNSAANKFNPDPTRNVKYGAQSWDEMNVSFVGILIDAKADPVRTFSRRGAPVRQAVE